MANETILLVEDNPDHEALTLRALRKNGLVKDVVVARDGVEALRYLLSSDRQDGRDLTVTPRVILLDLRLPKLDGLEVLRRIRAQDSTKLLPVVIFTSSQEDRDLLEAYSRGANSYICKPINFGQFAQLVQHLVQYWLALNLPPPSR